MRFDDKFDLETTLNYPFNFVAGRLIFFYFDVSHEVQKNDCVTWRKLPV